MKIDIEMNVQTKFVSGFRYSYDNYTAWICKLLERFHSPRVRGLFCINGTSWLSYDGLREERPGRDPIDRSMVLTSLCDKLVEQTFEFFPEDRCLLPSKDPRLEGHIRGEDE